MSGFLARDVRGDASVIVSTGVVILAPTHQRPNTCELGREPGTWSHKLAAPWDMSDSRSTLMQ